MTEQNEVTVPGLLAQAAQASSGAEVAQLVARAEAIRSEGYAAAAAQSSWDAGATEVADRLTPVAVHERHTAATDWIGELDTTAADTARGDMIALATNWYGELHPGVAHDADEFRIQAQGMAEREGGAYGESSDTAVQTFLTMAATLRARDIHRGVIKEAEIVGENAGVGMGAADVLGENPPTGEGYQGLPGSATDSNRAPNVAQMGPTQANDPGEGTGNGIADAGNGLAGEQRTPSPDPYHAASRRTANGGEMPEFLKNKINGDGDDDDSDSDDSKKEGSMQRQAIGQHVATCPSCGGFGGVATTEQGRQFIASLQRQGYSGLHQLDEIADPKDDPSQTPYPTDVAFPMEQGGWANGMEQIEQEIAQAENQIAQREKMASRMSPVQLARHTAEKAYCQAWRQVAAAKRPRTVWDMFSTAAQDDSGWLGDMGQGGQSPTAQDGLPPGSGNNLNYTDPVYGQGGDQPPGPRKPYGADEADDETNQPSSWAPGQPTQMDQADRGETLPPSGAPGFPDDGGGYGNQAGNQFQSGGSSKTSAFDRDPQVRQAQQFLAGRPQDPRQAKAARQFLAQKAAAYGLR